MTKPVGHLSVFSISLSIGKGIAGVWTPGGTCMVPVCRPCRWKDGWFNDIPLYSLLTSAKARAENFLGEAGPVALSLSVKRTPSRIVVNSTVSSHFSTGLTFFLYAALLLLSRSSKFSFIKAVGTSATVFTRSATITISTSGPLPLVTYETQQSTV